jgi:hypothetical protein
MNRLLLDTNRYSDLVANVGAVTSRVERAAEVWLTVISVGELRAGFALGTRRAQNEARLTQVLTLRGWACWRPTLTPRVPSPRSWRPYDDRGPLSRLTTLGLPL